jgi:diguanylate cyclase (GGDEF)-like protein
MSPISHPIIFDEIFDATSFHNQGEQGMENGTKPHSQKKSTVSKTFDTLQFLQAGLEVSQKLNGFFVEEITDAVVSLLPDLFQVSYVALFLAESDQEVLVCRKHNLEKPLGDKGDKVPWNTKQNVLGYCVMQDSPLLFSDMEEYEKETGMHFAAFPFCQYLKNSCLIVPLYVGYQKYKETVGMLVMADRKVVMPFQEIEKAVAMQLTDIVAYRVAYARLWEPGKSSAETEALSGIFQCHPIYEHLAREMHRASRYQSDFSLIMLDIDKFSEISHQFSAGTGEVVLKESAALIHQALRTLDVVSRLASSFFIILPQTKLNDAMLVAERLRKGLSQNTFSHKDHVIPITVSVGVVAYHFRDTPVSLLKKGELSLAHAKQRGGNQIVIYDIMQEAANGVTPEG